MFLLQETPPYNVNSPSAASNQPSDQRFDAEKGKTEEESGGEHVECPAKDLNKQFVMVPVAQPAETAPPTFDDEKLKLLLDGLQSISPHALQILAAAAQNASQKLECETSKQVEGESSKQGRGGKESTSRQRRTSQKAVRFDLWTELDTKPRKAKAAKPNVRKANSAKPKSKASTQAGPSDTSFVAAPAIKVERKRGIDGRYLQEEDAYTSDIQKAILEFVGQDWNDNKYWHKNLRDNWSRLAEAKRWGSSACMSVLCQALGRWSFPLCPLALSIEWRCAQSGAAGGCRFELFTQCAFITETQW